MKKNPLISTGRDMALLLAGALFWLAGCSARETEGGCDSSGELLILGGGYAIHGESDLLPALDALFADGAAE